MGNQVSTNVCDRIVSINLCIGCGLCAAICPPHVLEMKFNDYGEYQPVEIKEGCLPKCNLCLRGCPFWNQDDNEDTLAKALFGKQPGIRHSSETGYFLESYVGYSNVDEHRANGASGGMATWLLETLINQGFVDYVICVTQNPDPQKLYKYSVLNSVDKIRSASRSCYYPVELSEAIDFVLHNDGRYAITGLPCFLKGLRLAMRRNKRLRERLVFLVGLTCGQNKSKFFAQHLCAMAGGDPRQMNSCQFRIKDNNRPANNFGFFFVSGNELTKNGVIFWKDGMSEVWSRGYYKLNPCNYCDDIFAEVADIVFMDAWLDNYINDPKGTNLILIRNVALNNMLNFEQKNICLEIIPIEKVIQSQQDVINYKRNLLAERLYLLKLLGKSKYIINKRVIPSHSNFFRLLERWSELQLSWVSKKFFSKNQNFKGVLLVRNCSRPLIFLLKLIARFRYDLDRLGVKI